MFKRTFMEMKPVCSSRNLKINYERNPSREIKERKRLDHSELLHCTLWEEPVQLGYTEENRLEK